MELSAQKMAGDSAPPVARVKRRAEPVSGRLLANVILLLIGAYFMIPVLWLVVGAVDKHAGILHATVIRAVDRAGEGAADETAGEQRTAGGPDLGRLFVGNSDDGAV